MRKTSTKCCLNSRQKTQVKECSLQLSLSKSSIIPLRETKRPHCNRGQASHHILIRLPIK
uniref:Uncharacterized protein n=1 Tax=Rhizophora mucronata TaxID=61149 RepID=A0A2P2Q7J6_RHIMU